MTAVDLGVASAADTDVEAVDDCCSDVVCFTPATVNMSNQLYYWLIGVVVEANQTHFI